MNMRLKKNYYLLLAPAVAGFIAVFSFKRFSPYGGMFEADMSILAPAIFILAAVFAVAGPIFYRTFFAYRQRGKAMVLAKEFYKFERNQTAMAMMAPYLALAGFLIDLPRFHMSAVILMALYAIYYYYPNEKRIRLEERIYRAGR
jgi:hypothetical protein